MKKFFIFSMLCLFAVFGCVQRAEAQSSCTITTLPFTEDFESVGSGLPTCFTRNVLGLHPTNSMELPYVGSYQPHTGTHALRGFNNCYQDTAAQVPTLIFPELDSQFNLNDMVLEFWGRSAFYPSICFVVGVMDDPTDMSTFTAVETFTFLTADTYQKFTAYFTQYSGTGSYIAIKIANTLGTPSSPLYGEGFIDDITLDQAAMCSPVLNLSLVSILGQDVTINWQPNAMGAANSYNVTLYNLTDSMEVSVASTADTSYTFYNLDYSTNYRAYVTVVCTDNQESTADSVDFATLSPSVTTPYFEDFEGDSAIALMPFVFSGTGTNQWVYGTAAGLQGAEAQPGDPAHAIYVSPDSGATNIYANSISDAYATINVQFPNDQMEYHLAFDYRVVGEASDYSEFDYMKVYMMSSEATVPATGTPSGTPLLYHLGEVANISDWTHFDIILDNVAGTAKQIVFYWYNNGWNLYGDSHFAAAVDNISINGVSCAQPNNLTATDITTDGATLSWHEVGSATAWTLYYRAANSTDPFTEIQATDTFYTINGLTPNTDYNFYVVSDCGDGLSNPSVTATFRTDCGVIAQLPYTENFESGIYSTSQQNYIACWSRLTSDPSHYVYVPTASYYAHGGEHYLDFHYTPNCHVIAILPELDATIDASDLMLTFYACHTNYGYNTLGTLEVGVMTDKTNDSTFVVVDTIDISTLSGYTYAEQLVSLINYTGTGKYIAFRVSNCDGCGYYIDDLVLEQRPDCMHPIDFSAVSVGTDNVTLTWTELGDAASWNIQYDTVGFTAGQGANTVVADATTFTVDNLATFATYDFYVQADCGGTQSEWMGPVSIATGVINMGSLGMDTLTTCEAIICDNGGFDGDYTTYCDYVLVVYPATAGSGLEITGTCDLSLGSYGYGESHLYFHDGVGTAAPQIADITGINSNIAVAASGPITIHFTSSYNTGAGFMLNVSCATCTPPSNIAASNVENNAITLSWSGNSSQYAVYMTGAATGYYTTSDTTLYLSGLTPNSDYTFQLRSLCGSDSSLLSPALSVSTLCDAITITSATPWFEDFEGYTGGGNQPFSCWSIPVMDDIYYSPFVYCGHTPSCHSGANSAEFKGSSAMLALPVFSNDVHELRLSFWATSTDTTSGLLEVGVMSDFNDPNTFEIVGVCGTPGPRGNGSDTANGNYMGPFDFINVQAPNNARIALRYSNSGAWNSWNLDDFTVEIAPANPCMMPTGLTVTNIDTNSATVSWIPGGSETSWELQYKTAVSSNWGSEISVAATTYNLTGLTPGTMYEVRVKSDCGNGDESIWTTPYTFSTVQQPVVQPTVVTLAASDLTQTAGTMNGAITNEGNQTIILKGFEWKLSTDNDFTPVVTLMGNTLTYTLTGLTPNTCIDYRAYATTPAGTVYGETLSFCTLPGDTPEPCDAPTGLYVETTATGDQTNIVRWDDNENVSQWNVQYKTANTDWTTETVSTNYYQIVNIQYNELYSVRVQAVCDGSTTSDWTDTVNLMVLCGIEDYLQSRVSLYPNPAKEVVNVQCTMNNVQLDGELHLFDVYGKLLQIVPITSETTQINVSGLADGMYFVRVTTEAGTVTKSFLKK